MVSHKCLMLSQTFMVSRNVLSVVMSPVSHVS